MEDYTMYNVVQKLVRTISCKNRLIAMWKCIWF